MISSSNASTNSENIVPIVVWKRCMCIFVTRQNFRIGIVTWYQTSVQGVSTGSHVKLIELLQDVRTSKKERVVSENVNAEQYLSSKGMSVICWFIDLYQKTLKMKERH